ncbi:MAG TPA: FAD-dependent oxidoreductase [Flavobacterium sp.]|nr:FAD-dependent oxidoreductase [Flavobacterium sp.]
MNRFDVIIIGKGPAGISAGLYLKRSRCEVLIIGKDFGALDKAEKIENYYGLENPISGKELSETGIKQAEQLGIDIFTCEVTSVEATFEEPYRFKISATQGEKKQEFLSKSLLIATGKQRKTLRIPGFDDFNGKGISFCATCDGFFYKNKTVGVLGAGSYAMSELSYLYNLSQDILLFTNGDPQIEKTLLDSPLPEGVRLITDKLSQIYGTEYQDNVSVLAGVETKDNEGNIQRHDLQGLFVALGTAGASEFATKLGLATGEGTNAGTILTDDGMRTNVPGVYAAGDATGGFLQIVKAASDGAIAAKSIGSDLKELSR